eukprot:12373090-Alexandrium_andersonii.AAC.1
MQIYISQFPRQSCALSLRFPVPTLHAHQVSNTTVFMHVHDGIPRNSQPLTLVLSQEKESN